MDVGSNVYQTNDGGYLISADLLDGAVGYFIGLIKTDSLGDTVWTKKYGPVLDQYLSYHVAEIPASGYLLTFISLNSNLVLVRTNLNGDTLWSKLFEGNYLEMGIPLQLTADSGIIMACTSLDSLQNKTDILLIKTDLNGNMIWTRSYGTLADDNAYALIQSNDSGYVILGSTDLGIMNNYDVLLIKTDSTGNFLWAKTYGSWDYDYGNSVFQTMDGGYIISARTGSGGLQSLIRTDSIGDTLWVKGFYSASAHGESSVLQTDDGEFIMMNTITDFSGLDKANLMKIDGNGDTLWTQVYGDNALHNFSFSGAQTEEGGFIFVGTSRGLPPDSVKIYLIKTDSSGWSGCYQSGFPNIIANPLRDVNVYNPLVSSTNFITSVGGLMTIVGYNEDVHTLCLNVGMEEPSFNYSSFEIYPNPTLNEFSISGNYYGQLEIFDIMGNLVLKTEQFDSKPQTVHAPSKAGVYFVKMKNENEIFIKKLIVQ